ncbi:hypothetical protein [Prosthecobacter fusiformis]|nr:hypothetical protein [Prosthecobacter fusiformis]
MPTSREEWTAALVSFAAKKHADEPIALRSEFTDEEEQQCRILGGHLLSWLEDWGPSMMAERNAQAAIQGWDENPHVVYLTAGPGLAAAEDILAGAEDDVTWLTVPQFQEFLALHPDEKQAHHCILESWLRKPTAEEAAEGQSADSAHAEGSLWVHHDHTLMGPSFTRGGLSLWSYRDEKMALVKEAFQSWFS